jgi:hypothetical protein
MPNTLVKIAAALLVVLTWPAASFARGGHGGSVGFARHAGAAGTGNVPIAQGPANVGGLNNVAVDSRT